jgi:hypothetical protein
LIFFGWGFEKKGLVKIKDLGVFGYWSQGPWLKVLELKDRELLTWFRGAAWLDF